MTHRDRDKLRGKKIGILAGDGFEYAELAVPKAALKAAGAEVEVISLHDGRIRGMNLTEPTLTVRVDRRVAALALGAFAIAGRHVLG